MEKRGILRDGVLTAPVFRATADTAAQHLALSRSKCVHSACQKVRPQLVRFVDSRETFSCETTAVFVSFESDAELRMEHAVESFAPSYLSAREKFLNASVSAGAQISSYDRTDEKGAEGEALCVDVATLGPLNAVKAAIVISGTHGAEAYAGSAIQTEWLRGQRRFPDDVKLIFVHGVNPWGFSHKTRTTETNIDLNRNFRRSWQSESNEGYARLARFYHQTDSDVRETLRDWRDFRTYLDNHGWHLENLALGGQSDFPDGLFFSGHGPDPANLMFRQILRDHLGTALQIGYIDWHTGVGDFGEMIHLVFAEAGSLERRLASDWWNLLDGAALAFASGAVPKYTGLLCEAIAEELPSARVAGAVIEFGTTDAYGLFRADRLDRWLRYEGRHDPDATAFKQSYLEACTPSDPGWRRFALQAGIAQIDRLLIGLRDWPEE